MNLDSIWDAIDPLLAAGGGGGDHGIRRVHRRWGVRASTWEEWYPEQRHAARAVAVWRSMNGGAGILSHTSAAVLHGLPFFRYAFAKVHITGARTDGRVASSSSTARHRGRLDVDAVEIGGVRVTSLARTVADIAGRLPLATAVGMMDAALRRVAWDPALRQYDVGAAEAFRARVLAQPALARGARERVRAVWVVAFGDGRAASVGEAVSRFRFHEAGFAPPRLQVRIPHATGWYDVDLGLDDVALWGEFDGTGKYTDPLMLGAATTAEVLLAEKAREDHIRGLTRRAMIRWGSAHIATEAAFRARMRELAVPLPRTLGAVPPEYRGPRL